MANQNDTNKAVELEILEANYWEHFKIAKDMAMYLPLNHKRRVKIESEMNKLTIEIHKLKQDK